MSSEALWNSYYLNDRALNKGKKMRQGNVTQKPDLCCWQVTLNWWHCYQEDIPEAGRNVREWHSRGKSNAWVSTTIFISPPIFFNF